MYRVPLKVQERVDGYVVSVPAVPGWTAGGRTREEALGKAREMIRVIFAFSREAFPGLMGQVIPSSDEGETEYVDVSLPFGQAC